MSTTPPPATETKTPEPPKTMFERLGAALPVAMTALATVFAGMSAAQLQQAMKWKSQTAVDQAKATNQWSLFGFKRDRSLVMQSSAAQLRAASNYAKPAKFVPPPFKPDKNEKDQEKIDKAKETYEKDYKEGVAWLEGKGPPRDDKLTKPPEEVQALIDAIQKREPEAKLIKLAGALKQKVINDTIDTAEKENKAIDDKWNGPSKAAMSMATASGDESSMSEEKLRQRSANLATGYDLENRRYRGEAYFNQQLGYLYDARVKFSDAQAEKHQNHSTMFFYAMLAAQIGSTVAALALNRKKGAPLSVFAAVMGILASGVGGFVLLQQYVLPILG